MTVLVACGLQREARIFAAPGVVAVAGGGDAARLEAELERHAGAARLILSSGLCGALDPSLKVGDLVVGRLAQPIAPLARSLPLQRGGRDGDQSGQSSILDDPHPTLRLREGPPSPLQGEGSGTAAPDLTSLGPSNRNEDSGSSSGRDESLLKRLCAVLPDARTGSFEGVDGIVATTAEKAALHARTGALAADMESHVAERVARRHGLPFAILRAVSDDANRSLPPAALVGMRPDGGVDLGAVLKSLAKNPAQLPALVRTGRDAEKAFRALLGGFHRLRAGAGDLDAHLLDVV